MTRKSRRLLLISCALGVLGIAAGLVLFALSDTIVFFRSPSDIAAQHPAPGTRLRLGGLVKAGSVDRQDGTHVRFVVTDGGADVPVSYVGILPDLFREGQGVVAEGTLEPDGGFRADTVLAKHDEKYMPKEVVEALKKQGVWQEGEGGVPARATPPATPPAVPGPTSSAQ